MIKGSAYGLGLLTNKKSIQFRAGVLASLVFVSSLQDEGEQAQNAGPQP
jgi:hypothetical protein